MQDLGTQVALYKELQSQHREEDVVDEGAKHRTWTQETGVCVLCETKSQH